eukprot:gnl/TRDRNA2_/TRDRNA2_204156_c0_seq1.p1 gnl/TRDRNA2_/TRDRNA2_204156_c0~~gnl/TRDRNA2_/TRDRNA2_204156_c0_seq1.p1  ORF type:complete len:408 (+),score=84.25 gnl/TRDRNA2_/TRDRNA2_204156_c0_seq1:67-1290(+)
MDVLTVLAELKAAKPTVPAQLVALVVAMIAMEVFIKVGSIILGKLFKDFDRMRLGQELEMHDVMSGKKPSLLDTEGDFKAFCQTRGVMDYYTWKKQEAEKIAEVDNQTDKAQALELLKSEHSVDAYMAKHDSHRKAFSDFACKVGSETLMLQLQHGIAGGLGALALCVSDQATFVTLARWGMLCEAGWELGDWLLNIIPSIINGRAAMVVPMILHHFCLYGLIPANLYAIDGPCGRYIAWALLIMAGIIGPLGSLMFAKQCLDFEKPIEKRVGDVILLSVVVIVLVSRGPVWWWLAYELVTNSKELGFAVHALFIALAVLFSLFNVIFYVMAAELVKIVLTAHDAADAEAKRAVYMKAVAALANPLVFHRVHGRMGKTHWSHVKVAYKLHILKGAGKQSAAPTKKAD